MSSDSKRQWMQSYEGKIRVGPEYQAMIPPFYKANYPQSQNKNPQNPNDNNSTTTSTAETANTSKESNLSTIEAILNANLNTPNGDEDNEYIQPYDNLGDESYDLDISNHLQFQEEYGYNNNEFDLKAQYNVKANDDVKDEL